MQLTDQQEGFIAEVLNTKHNIVLEAVAGSGKTTTIVHAINDYARKFEYDSILCCAFNRKIAETLATRLPATVASKTTHQLGYAAWSNRVNTKLKLAKRKLYDITQVLWKDELKEERENDGDDLFEYLTEVRKLVAQAKNAGIVPSRDTDNATGLLPDLWNSWVYLIDHFDLDFEEEVWDQVIKDARAILEMSNSQSDKGIIDFDDMIYMPVTQRCRFKQYDLVFIDEAQDIAPLQREMLRSLIKIGGRLIAVGDPNQAIYGFRGADHQSMEMIQKEFETIVLPLTYSFRCPKSVVTKAHEYVSHIQSAPNAINGIVEELEEWDETNVTGSDVIICRNTKPLVDMAFRLLARNVPCWISGRGIDGSIIHLLKKLEASSVADAREKVGIWEGVQRKKLMDRGMGSRAEIASDKAQTLQVVLNQLPDDAVISEAIKKVKELFPKTKRGVTLTTGHKGKGMEWRRVFFLDSDLIPSKYATSPWQIQQETNLKYVIVTRAMEQLFFVKSEDFDGGNEE